MAGGSLAALRDQPLHKGSDQPVRNRFAQRKLDGAFAGEVRSDLSFEILVQIWDRIHADVLFPSGKVDHRPTSDAEGRNRVADRLRGLRSRSTDCLPCGVEHSLHLRWKAADVVID